MQMNINYQNGLHIGADGCRGGWIAAVLDYGELRIERYQSFESATAQYSATTMTYMRPPVVQ